MESMARDLRHPYIPSTTVLGDNVDWKNINLQRHSLESIPTLSTSIITVVLRECALMNVNTEYAAVMSGEGEPGAKRARRAGVAVVLAVLAGNHLIHSLWCSRRW